jgi:glycine/D-amino acid oxidase-like deaminating enzyme
VEPRKRFTWIFTAETPLDRELPLTIDPSGVHVRQDGKTSYLAGGHADYDPAVDYDDFAMDHGLWQDHVWPALATRIPQFEAIKLTNEWAGHYAYNTFDHNAIMGAHEQVRNFVFLNGFSGHGLQQSPAMGRGTAEMLVYGEYRSLDMSPYDHGRIARNEHFVEKAVI